MTRPRDSRFPVAISLKPLPNIDEALFVQAPIAQGHAIGRVAASDQVGAIYTLSSRLGKVATQPRTIEATIQAHRATAGDRATVMVDASRYSGQNRAPASADLTPEFVDFQLGLGLPWALTDSGYVSETDLSGLHSILAQASDLTRSGRRVVATLPVASTWLSNRSDELRDAIEQYAIPIGIAVEHTDDPFGSRHTVAGLLHLLQSAVPVALIRSDLSAVGGLAAGATLGAIGTRSGLRHIFPAKGGGPGKNEYHSILVPRALTWIRYDKLAEAVAQTPDELHWLCDCEVCMNGRVDSLIDPTRAFAHNLHTAGRITRRVLGRDVATSLRSWIAKCDTAQNVGLDLESMTQMDFIPRYLGAWKQATHRSLIGQPLPTE